MFIQRLSHNLLYADLVRLVNDVEGITFEENPTSSCMLQKMVKSIIGDYITLDVW